MVFLTTVFSLFKQVLGPKVINTRNIYLVSIIAAIWLRVYLPGEYPFNFDQVQIAENSQKIFSGDLVLIGPRTGPAAMFTGPLIYYIAAPFQAFLSDPYVVVAAAVTISLLTGIVVFLLTKRYLKRKTALIFFCLWSISPLIVWFDRVPWNPNLTILAASLVFLPLYAKKFTYIEALLMAVGVFLGYQAHFSGLFLLPLAVLSLFYVYQKQMLKNVWWLLLPIAFAASVAPTILFDFRHDWHNITGLHTLLTEMKNPNQNSLLFRFFEKVFIVAETIGKIVVFGPVQKLHVTLGLFFASSYSLLIINKKLERTYWLPLLWSLGVAIAFSFYHASSPEYYFFILIPALLLIVSSILSQLSRSMLVGAGILFLIYVLWEFIAYIKPNEGFRISEQLKTAAFIQKTAQDQGIREIIYDTTPVDSEGIRYLLAQQPVSTTPLGKIIHIQYPHSNALLQTEKFSDNMAVWVDERTDSDQQYLIGDQFLITYPQDVALYESHVSEDKNGSEIGYVVFYNQQKIGLVQIYDKEKSRSTFEKLKETYFGVGETTLNHNNWLSIDGIHYYQQSGRYGIIITNTEGSENNVSKLLTLYLENPKL